MGRTFVRALLSCSIHSSKSSLTPKFSLLIIVIVQSGNVKFPAAFHWFPKYGVLIAPIVLPGIEAPLTNNL